MRSREIPWIPFVVRVVTRSRQLIRRRRRRRRRRCRKRASCSPRPIY